MKSKTSSLAFVALGSNLGDSRKIILDAMARLQNFSDEPILKSSLWQTSPVDCPPNSPQFVNAIVGIVPRENETPERDDGTAAYKTQMVFDCGRGTGVLAFGREGSIVKRGRARFVQYRPAESFSCKGLYRHQSGGLRPSRIEGKKSLPK